MDLEHQTSYLPDDLFRLYLEANSSLPQVHLEEKAFFIEKILCDTHFDIFAFANSALSPDQANIAFRSATNQHKQQGIEVSISEKDERMKVIWEGFKDRIIQTCTEILFRVIKKKSRDHKTDVEFIHKALTNQENKIDVDLLQEIFRAIKIFLRRSDIRNLKEEHKLRIKAQFDEYLRSRNQHHIESSKVSHDYDVDTTIVNQIVEMMFEELSLKFKDQIDPELLKVILNKLKS